jgi:sugar phosphate isomerase/epimerase
MRQSLRWLAAILFVATVSCNSDENNQNTTENNSNADSSLSHQWKLGIALWTFHTVDFPTSLAQVDSCEVRYIEPNTFHATGKELKDTLLGQLSPAGLEKLNAYVHDRGLEVGSLYLGGGKTVGDWKKDFETAKALHAKFVTAEPPVDMWDQVDSLAGVYGLNVAIHEHWKGVSAYWHPDSVLAAMKNHPHFYACADLGHWPKSGINPLEAVKKLDGRILGIHLKDIAAYNNPKLQDVRVGTGVVDFPAIFKELKRQHFSGMIYIERDSQEVHSNVPSVIETVRYYNDQMKKLDQ